jgi:hypothetical protein
MKHSGLILQSCFASACALAAICCNLPYSAAASDLPTFAGTRLVSAGITFPSAIATADFNHDGLADVAAVGQSSSNIVVLLANGNGTFQPPVSYGTTAYGFYTATITPLDANHDGELDVIAAGDFGSWLLLGNGDGTFQPATQIYSSGAVSAFGDFNGDHILDYANYSAPSVGIELGNGDGTFQPGGGYTVSFTASADFMTYADMNHDGIKDLVLACNGSHGLVSVLLGKGDGTFKNAANTTVGTYDNALAVGDFNADGTNDVAVTDYNAGTVTVLLGKGDGTFINQVTYTVGSQPQSVVTEDFDRNGTVDLAVACATNGVVLLGHGDGTFQSPQSYGWLKAPVATGDFDGDGKADLVNGGNGLVTSLGISLGNGDGTFQGTPYYAVEKGPKCIAIGDLNGDGKAELVVANAQSNNISVLLNNGNGTFQAHTNYTTAAGPQSVVIADFGGHGTNDVAVADSNLSFLRGNGDGTLQTATSAGSVPLGAGYVLAGDFNNDHKTDLAALGLSSSFTYGVSVFLGNGNDTFQSPPISTAGPFIQDQLATGDFNGDGKLDVAYDNVGSNTVSVMLGNGNGSFQAPVSYDAGSNVQSVAIGDFNGDGTNDLAVASFGDGSGTNGTVSVLLNDGDGTFGPATNCLTGDAFQSVAAGDFNADGKMDLAVVTFGASGKLEVLPGNGDGTFQSPITFAVGNTPSFVTAGDLNGDGLPDLAVANAADNSVSVLLNTYIQVGPMLKMQPLQPGASSITFTWPASAANYHLESIADLGSGNWQTPSLTKTTNGDNVEVTVQLGAGSRFFRLHK